jgi:hypothetical protein
MSSAGGTPTPTPATPLSINFDVSFDKATPGAIQVFKANVESYANLLALESAKAELSRGSSFDEVSKGSVEIAAGLIAKYGTRAKGKGKPFDIAAFIGLPIFSGVAGTCGGNLNSSWQWSVFAISLFLGVFCLGYLAKRRLMT